MALDFSSLTAEVARNRSVDGSAAALIRGIAQRIQDAIAADDLQDSEAINALVTDLQASTNDLSAAVSENTPAPVADPPDPDRWWRLGSTSMPDIGTIKDGLVVIALVLLAGRELLRWRDGRKLTGTNGRSGDKAPGFWELTIANIVKAELDAYDTRTREPEAHEAANERRQIHAKLNQLAAMFELSVQEKQRQLAEAISEIKAQLKRNP